MAGARSQREEEDELCGRRTRGPPLGGLYGRRGEGSGIVLRRGSTVWPGMAGVREKPNRQIGTENPCIGKRVVRRGAEACGYVESCVGRGAWLIDCARENPKGRATCAALKSRAR